MPVITNNLRDLGLGRLKYHLWHRPVSRIITIIREGGPLEQRKTENGRRAMENAARTLPVLENISGDLLELHLLTGDRFWYQSVFCLWSFSRQSERPVRPVVYDDGTLPDSCREYFMRLFPETRFYTQNAILSRINVFLEKFPVIADLRRHYPNIRKLTDVHMGQAGWKLVVDSDLLFFHRPSLLIDWLNAPQYPLHAVDSETSYGYSREMLNTLAGSGLEERVNVGLTGLQGEEIDWEKIEGWCRTLLEREGMHYYLEQAVIAMLVAGRHCIVAPEKEYVTLPRPPETAECHAVMHHYVADSKRWYFQHNWQRAMESN